MLEELIDRFGDPPKSVTNLLLIAQLKAKAHRVYIREVMQKGNEFKLVLYERAKIDVARIPELIDIYKTRLKFMPDVKGPYFVLPFKLNDRKDEPEALALLEEFLGNACSILISEEKVQGKSEKTDIEKS